MSDPSSTTGYSRRVNTRPSQGDSTFTSTSPVSGLTMSPRWSPSLTSIQWSILGTNIPPLAALMYSTLPSTETIGSLTSGTGPSHMPRWAISDIMPLLSWLPYSMVSLIPTPISATRVFVPTAFREYASVDSSTVAAECTHMKSTFMYLASGTSSFADSSLILIWGISLRKMLLAWMSMHTSAPAMSSKISAATYSGMDPSLFPGNVRFMSRSKPGIPLVMESIPSGFSAG